MVTFTCEETGGQALFINGSTHKDKEEEPASKRYTSFAAPKGLKENRLA